MTILGNRYTLMTKTTSEFYGSLDGDKIKFHLKLTNQERQLEEVVFTYSKRDIPVNYDSTGLDKDPYQITNIAFGLFLLDRDGYVALSKSYRHAVAFLVAKYPGSINLELFKNGTMFEYKGNEILINSPTRFVVKSSIAELTRKYFNEHIGTPKLAV